MEWITVDLELLAVKTNQITSKNIFDVAIKNAAIKLTSQSESDAKKIKQARFINLIQIVKNIIIDSKRYSSANLSSYYIQLNFGIRMSASVVIPRSEEGSGVMEIEELQRQLTETQAALGSSEQMKNLLMKKVKECKDEKLNSQKEFISMMSILKDQKKEMMSLLEEQKCVIDELMLTESHKVKKIRKQKCDLIDACNEAKEEVKSVKKHNEVLTKNVSKEQQRGVELHEEIERLNKVLVEKESSLGEKATLVDQNQLLAASLRECKKCIAEKETEIAEVNVYLQQEKEKLNEVAAEFQQEKVKLEKDLNAARNEICSFELELHQIVQQNTSLTEKIDELTHEVERQQRASELHDVEFAELEKKNKNLKQDVDIISSVNEKSIDLNSRMQTQIEQLAERNSVLQMKLADNSVIWKKVEERNEKMMGKIERLGSKAEILKRNVSKLQTKKQNKFERFFKRIQKH